MIASERSVNLYLAKGVVGSVRGEHYSAIIVKLDIGRFLVIKIIVSDLFGSGGWNVVSVNIALTAIHGGHQ